ncbi:MAG: 6-carboxytetrahydropterin synthase [Gluconobacter cerinus]|uniref:6-pyruvoyl trahydropterin synthase family protein n=1 Tax=Gluconobacter TaxID=441 RepID=UPI001B8C2A31|nr:MULTISPECIES: 6-carboxytetrahydropterin synthase [Gluconobacter]MBS0995302.1 6-carboxytetrahydropterin synthase [Gluconobacter cerinus]MBS1020649.1 6-carboxytetrahydropterin synthase [Gluconobacter cerinus]
MTAELVFTRRFCMGHRLITGTSEKCAVPHGHNEYVKVTLRPVEEKRLDGHQNMILPFAEAKTRWHDFVDNSLDHALQLSEQDPLLAWFRDHEPERARRIVVTPGDPTTEVMTALLLAKLTAILADQGGKLRVHEIELEETPTNTVKLSGDPSFYLPQVKRAAQACWWNRADMSISDL